MVIATDKADKNPHPHGAYIVISSVQFSRSVVSDSETPWIAARQASLSITNSQSSLRLNVHRVGDAIQPSQSLSSPSPPAPNPSQHQGLFQWVSSSHEVAKVLEFQLQHHSLQRNPRADLLSLYVISKFSMWFLTNKKVHIFVFSLPAWKLRLKDW